MWLDNRDNLAELSAYNIDCIDHVIQSIEDAAKTDLPPILIDGKKYYSIRESRRRNNKN